MSKRTVFCLLFLAAAAAPLRAELKYVTHLEATKLPGPPQNPLFAAIGDMAINAVVPGLSMDVTTIIGEKGARVEQSKGTMSVPEGAVVLIRPDGGKVVFVPKDKTFWTIAATQPVDTATTIAQLSPNATAKRTGEMSTIAGTSAERVSFAVSMKMPLSDIPTSVTLLGDAWMAPQYKAYSAMAFRADPTLSMAPDLARLIVDGFLVRVVARAEVLGYQVEQSVTSITEESVPADVFEVPAGFKQIPAPAARIGGHQ